MRSTAVRLEQWVAARVRENRPRTWATRQGLQLSKYRYRADHACDPGRSGLATAPQHGGSGGCDLLGSSAEGMTLNELERYLANALTRAEIMDYLSQTYGAVFAGDLIKHLPQPG
ncbi:MAG TPA: hypothetical protein VJ757_00990 [Pseudonocardiaceae bacterium]|nr:hypothetical protein [Pseudonocardiaceae bacterium]